jgi:hypothetical protein
VKEPFKFANTFLRLLPAYKITWIQHLELRLSWRDFSYVDYEYRSKVPKDLTAVFRAYRELRNLDSLTLTLHGRLAYRYIERHIDFRTFEAGYEVDHGPEKVMDCMRKAGQALAYEMAIAEFDISEHVEDVDESTRSVAVRVKVQRKK